MEENIKNIASEVNEELIKLFGGKIERIILYGSYVTSYSGKSSLNNSLKYCSASVPYFT